MSKLPLTLLALISLLVAIAARADAVKILDGFESTKGWSTVAARGAQVSVTRDQGRRGHALRIDFDFRRGGGEVIIHKRFPITLPENYALAFAIRGRAPDNTLELRLADGSGQNVWRFRAPDFRFPKAWQTLRIKRRQLEFAWGPAGGGAITNLGWVELVIARGTGGHGTVWVDDLWLEPRPPSQPYSATPLLATSSALPDHQAEHLLEDPPNPTWHSAANAKPQWLRLDFRKVREYGGLVIDWDADDYATAYSVERSNDGNRWQRAYEVHRGNGGRDYLPLPESESRYLRFSLKRSSRGKGYGIRHIEVAALDFSRSPNHLFARIAQESKRGLYPRYFSGEQTYWTVVGSPGTEQRGADGEALLNEDGVLEVDAGGFSVEPFLYADGQLYTWADGSATPALERSNLPIPSVQMQRGPLSLTATILANGSADVQPILAYYRVTNSSQRPVNGSLFLTVRPFQVSPPWQSLHDLGGVSSIHRLRYRNAQLWVNEDRRLVPLTRPGLVGVTDFDGSPLTAELARNTVPNRHAVTDPVGFASGVLQYPLKLSPGEARHVYLAIPPKPGREGHNGLPQRMRAGTFWKNQYTEAIGRWETKLGRVGFRVPPGSEDLVQTLRTNLAYILIHRDGPALRPGSRRYGRTWIRDAAVTSATLLALGHAEEVRAFLRWYASYQTVEGAVPCCLDSWGPDFMIEHDSAGEFIYTVGNYYRYTKDVPFLQAMWPNVSKAADYLAALRRQRLTPEYTQGERSRFFGLIPESASHEGYMARPVHAYWDDFWAVRGLADAAQLAAVLGDPERAKHYAQLQDALRADVRRSIELTQAKFGIDYVPGSAELGDFDPTSVAIALTVGDEETGPLVTALRRTFARYATERQARTQGQREWEAYTPYEFRNVTALVRLGERDAAFQALESLFEGRRPTPWNQWPEVVWRDFRAPRFIGDMPHSWIGAEFIQSFLALFCYEGHDGQLVLGAGLPSSWVSAPGGVEITNLQTSHGRLTYHVNAPVPGETRFHIKPGLTIPPGGLVLDLPLPQPVRLIEVNGRHVDPTGSRLTITALPAEIVLRQ